MAHGLTELIGTGGHCGAVSHQPHIQPWARPGGQGRRDGGRDGDSAQPAPLLGFLPPPPATQGWG